MEASTLTKPQTVRYWSVSDNFQIIRLRPERVHRPDGSVFVRNEPAYEGAIVKFQNNQYEATHGAKMLPSGPPDADGNPTMEDEVTFLERQPSFGVYFHRVDAEVPDASEVHNRITELGIAGDLDGLVALAQVEFSAEGWQRQEVGEGIVSALSALYQAATTEKRKGEIDEKGREVLALVRPEG